MPVPVTTGCPFLGLFSVVARAGKLNHVFSRWTRGSILTIDQRSDVRIMAKVQGRAQTRDRRRSHNQPIDRSLERKQMRTQKRYLASATILGIFLGVGSAFAHVTISPTESSTGTTETYTMNVPTERDTATVRIEATFPMGMTVSDFESKTGWAVEPEINAEGHVVSAVWSGGSIPPGQAEQFSFTARNPGAATTLMWQVVQIHADGSIGEWGRTGNIAVVVSSD